MSFRKELHEDAHLEISFWSDVAKKVSLVIKDRNVTLPMNRVSENLFCIKTNLLLDNEAYYFLVDNFLQVPDPFSRQQLDDVHGASVFLAQDNYQWMAKDWKGLDWNEAIIYELHVGTFTPEGTFDGARQKLDYLKELGVTAIELMPVADYPGKRNWGYDGVLPYAPTKNYGSPDDLKRLIDEAHQKGIMVFLDVVYNHFGPEGNYLWCYAKSFFTDEKLKQTPWGSAINFDGANSEVVREFFIQNAIYWINEFRFDGLRIDAVHTIFDNSDKHILNEIKERVLKELIPERKVYFILENDNNDSRLLKKQNNSQEKNLQLYDAQWNDDFHHSLHVLITKEKQEYYKDYSKETLRLLGESLSQGFVYQKELLKSGEQKSRRKLTEDSSEDLSPVNFINFIQNHDQIGNRPFGERIHNLISRELCKMASAILLLCPSIPMLFMGEEWLSKSPFLYFCDLEADLSAKVKEGRIKKYTSYMNLTDEKKQNLIPDPTDLISFERSLLDWDLINVRENKRHLEFYKNLIQIRKTKIIPLLKCNFVKSGYKVINNNLLDVYWNFESESNSLHTKKLNLIMNFSEQTIDLSDENYGLTKNSMLNHSVKNSETNVQSKYDLIYHSNDSKEHYFNKWNLEKHGLICFLTSVTETN